MVFKHSLKIRFLAAFVVAFICLNAGGAACVAYCRTNDSIAATTEHCPLKKQGHHCDKTTLDTGDAITFRTGEIDCCPMTVSFFPAPIEKQTFKFEPAAVAVLVVGYDAPVSRVISKLSIGSLESYRGPPLIDRRTDRIKQRLLLI